MGHNSHTYTATVRGERRIRMKRPDGTKFDKIETVEAVIQIELNLASIANDLGQRAIRNTSRKAAEMGGAIKAKTVSETILDSRESTW